MTYLCDPRHASCPDRDRSLISDPASQCWHESLARRLDQQGGPSANAAADLAAWNRLGQRHEAAA